MGGDAMYRLIGLTKARGSARLVLIALASYADRRGECWPSISQIARRASVTRQTAIAALRWLEKSSELQMIKRGRVDQRTGQKVNVYQLRALSGAPIDDATKHGGDETLDQLRDEIRDLRNQLEKIGRKAFWARGKK